MTIKNLHPILWTMNLQDTVDFYVKFLGFKLEEKNENWGWVLLNNNDTKIMFATPPDSPTFIKPTFSGSFYFTLENIDDYWSKLDEGIQICYPIEDFEWGMREFAIFDNNGYILQFGQEIK